MTLRNPATPHLTSVRFIDDEELDHACHCINVVGTDDIESVWFVDRTVNRTEPDDDAGDGMTKDFGNASSEDAESNAAHESSLTPQPSGAFDEADAVSISTDISADEVFNSNVAEEIAPNADHKSSEVSARPARPALDPAAGPVIAELVATRAELRRVEGELSKAVAGLRNAELELQKAARERDALAELKESHARLQADFDNFRKRAERGRVESHHALAAELVTRLLPVADNFRRALEVETQQSEGLQQFVLGVELICKQLDDVLAAYGVEAITAIGEIFDPHIHEAIATEATTDIPPNTIVAEIVRGYRLGDKLCVRHWSKSPPHRKIL
jgi:molecular chaperone GrpE